MPLPGAALPPPSTRPRPSPGSPVSTWRREIRNTQHSTNICKIQRKRKPHNRQWRDGAPSAGAETGPVATQAELERASDLPCPALQKSGFAVRAERVHCAPLIYFLPGPRVFVPLCATSPGQESLRLLIVPCWRHAASWGLDGRLFPDVSTLPKRP